MCVCQIEVALARLRERRVGVRVSTRVRQEERQDEDEGTISTMRQETQQEIDGLESRKLHRKEGAGEVLPRSSHVEE